MSELDNETIMKIKSILDRYEKLDKPQYSYYAYVKKFLKCKMILWDLSSALKMTPMLKELSNIMDGLEYFQIYRMRDYVKYREIGKAYTEFYEHLEEGSHE
jgi:hypothetical protein